MMRNFLNLFSFCCNKAKAIDKSIEINSEELNNLFKNNENIRLIDVRTDAERKISYIHVDEYSNIHDVKCLMERSLFTKKNEFDQRLQDDIKPMNHMKTIVYCRGGVRSLQVVKALLQQGHKKGDVFSLYGGIEAWQDYNEPSLKENNNYCY